MAFGVQEITLAIIIGTLAAIVYCLRILVLMERRIARIESHIERVVDKIVKGCEETALSFYQFINQQASSFCNF